MRDAAGGSPLHRAENAVRPYVLYLVLPVFALAAAGAVLSGPLLGAATHPIAVGIAAGLVVGKPVGIVVFSLLAGAKAEAPLAHVKEVMVEHNVVIMVVILVILGAKLLGDGLQVMV